MSRRSMSCETTTRPVTERCLLLPPNPVFMDPILPDYGHAETGLVGPDGLDHLSDRSGRPSVHHRDQVGLLERPLAPRVVAARADRRRDPRKVVARPTAAFGLATTFRHLLRGPAAADGPVRGIAVVLVPELDDPRAPAGRETCPTRAQLSRPAGACGTSTILTHAELCQPSDWDFALAAIESVADDDDDRTATDGDDGRALPGVGRA